MFSAFRQNDVVRVAAVELARQVDLRCRSASPVTADDSAVAGEGSAQCAAEKRLEVLSMQGLPIGWKLGVSMTEWLASPRHWLGFFLTALALSLGANFWFELLTRFMNFRATGDSPEKKATKKIVGG